MQMTFLIQFNLSLLFSFLLGVGIGIALMALIYLILVLTSIRSKKYVVQSQTMDVSDEEILALIQETKDMFNDRNLKGAQSNIEFAKNISVELVLNIAKKFFPESKHPLYELSINEVLMLGSYVSKRLDEVLDYRGIRIIRKLKISTIVGFTEVKEKIESSSVVKATKKYKIMEALSATKKVINIVNPVYWARRLIINTSINVVVKRLCLIMISVVGEETYKIYSKSVFDREVQIDTGIKDIVSDIEKDLEIEANQSDSIEDADDKQQALPAPEGKKSIFSRFKKQK